MPIKRRDFLAASAALAGVAGLSPFGHPPVFRARRGAELQAGGRCKPQAVCRWTPFVKGDEDAWLANTKKFTEATGVEVRIDKESWEDIRPKAAVAANVGSGP